MFRRLTIVNCITLVIVMVIGILQGDRNELYESALRNHKANIEIVCQTIDCQQEEIDNLRREVIRLIRILPKKYKTASDE